MMETENKRRLEDPDFVFNGGSISYSNPKKIPVSKILNNYMNNDKYEEGKNDILNFNVEKEEVYLGDITDVF